VRLPVHEWVTLGTCALYLALAVIALRGSRQSTLALPLSLVCLDWFVFNAADAAGHLTGSELWRLLDEGAASLGVPLALRFVIVFTGGGARPAAGERWIGAYAGGVALLCGAAALGVPAAVSLTSSDHWAELLLPAALATVGWCLWRLTSHLRHAASLLERSRTRLVLGAFLIAAVGNIGDLLADGGLPLPRNGPASSAIAAVLLTLAAQRYGLFVRRISWLYALNAAVLGVLQIALYAAIFVVAGNRPTVLVVATSALTLALAPLLVAVIGDYSRERERLVYHATLGRFSEQMAHDLRNPLQVVKGAAEYLEEERRRHGEAVVGRDYLRLILEQVERLERVVGNYRRLGRVDPVLARSDINEVVEGVLGAQAVALPPGIALRRDLSPSLPPCPLDRDLVAAALENLLRNAVEAMPDAGVLTVRTSLSGSEGELVRIEVEDTGQGMDTRRVQQAFGEFFTSKAHGTGLGLPFVRRVAEAHRGDVALVSAEGRGTTVRLHLSTTLGQTPPRGAHGGQ